MKSLHITSFNDPAFKNLIQNKFLFHFAVKNYLKDQHELNQTIKSILAILVGTFAGEKAGKEIVKDTKELDKKLIAEHIRRMLEHNPKLAVSLYKGKHFKDLLRGET